MNSTVWATLPYVAFTSFVLGHLWRYRNDQFGWTTRSSQIYESRLLKLGSPLFHFGMLGVIGGHVLGVLIPQSWTAAIGISEHVSHLVAVTAGTAAGLAVLALRAPRPPQLAELAGSDSLSVRSRCSRSRW